VAHQHQIARNQAFVTAGIDHREVAFLLARHQGSLKPALIEVLDDGAGVFDR